MAVGNPISRPRCAPWMTSPDTENGRPSESAAKRTSPDSTARRIEELLMTSPPSITRGIATVRNPSACADLGRCATHPPHGRGPVRTLRQPRARSGRCASFKLEKKVLRRAASQGAIEFENHDLVGVEGLPASVSFRPAVQMRPVNLSGRSTEAGTGSKVTMVERAPSSMARSRVLEMSLACPR